MPPPIRAVDYFTVKLAASSAAFASFYLFGVVGALCTFPWRLKGFVVSDFLALSAVHFFAAIFAATFAGTIALFFKRKLTGLLVSIIVLGTLVGSSWLGFINPAYLTISYFNPFFQGISVIAKIQNYDAWDISHPIIVLVMFNLLMLAIGRHRAPVVLEDRQAGVRPDKVRRDETRASAAPQMSLSPRLSTAAHVYTGTGHIAHDAPGSFKTFLLSESLKALRVRHVLSLMGLALMGVILTFWLPSFPESVFRFFSRVLDLPSWPQIIIANFLAGLLFFYFLDRRGRRAPDFCDSERTRLSGHVVSQTSEAAGIHAGSLTADHLRSSVYRRDRITSSVGFHVSLAVFLSAGRIRGSRSGHDRLGCFARSDSKFAHYACARYIYRANVGLHPFYDFYISWYVLHLQT